MTIERPSAVLFACNMNSIRSPIAAALAARRFGRWMHVDSCGVERGYLEPFAVFVMDELGVDIERHESKRFEDLESDNFDLVVALTEEAEERAKAFTRRLAAEVERWTVSDPSLAIGSRETRLQAFRTLRDELDQRIAERFKALSTRGA